MKTKMIGLLVTLMVALMVSGFAYAHWSKIITINGTVNTGRLHLTPSFEGSTDDDKEYCTVEGVIEGNTLTVTINNAYPCITVTIKFDLHNDGSVPAGLYMWTATYDNNVITIFNASNFRGSIINPTMTEDEVEQALEDYVEKTLGLGTYVDVEIDFEGSNFWQIDPCEEPYVIITIHFLEDLPQDTSCSFTMELEYWNWNEVGYLG
mgnify:FL=1